MRVLLAALVLASSSPSGQGSFEPLEFDRGATGLGLALRRVGTTARVLYVTAHPDDEHNGILVRLSRGLGVRTALLTVTRGEGGQNAIGPELFDALGVLRTGELLALHRYDGVEQYFGRAYEFGYSFSVEETFAKWGREETLGVHCAPPLSSQWYAPSLSYVQRRSAPDLARPFFRSVVPQTCSLRVGIADAGSSFTTAWTFCRPKPSTSAG